MFFCVQPSNHSHHDMIDGFVDTKRNLHHYHENLPELFSHIDLCTAMPSQAKPLITA